jgi:hypothetical protein
MLLFKYIKVLKFDDSICFNLNSENLTVDQKNVCDKNREMSMHFKK